MQITDALSGAEAAAGRALRQVTDSFGTQGGNPYNNPVQIYAHAREVRASVCDCVCVWGGVRPWRQGACALAGPPRLVRALRARMCCPSALAHAPRPRAAAVAPRTRPSPPPRRPPPAPPPRPRAALDPPLPPPLPPAPAPQAEAWSHARAIGIYQNQGATVTTAGDTYPAARSQAVTQNGQQGRRGRARAAGGVAPANPISLFGPTAIATTEQGFRAMSAVNGMPMQERRGYRQAAASTTSRWEMALPRQGTGKGKERLVFTESLGYTAYAPLSNGISENGGGPTAVATAGEAVAMSQADVAENDRYGFGN